MIGYVLSCSPLARLFCIHRPASIPMGGFNIFMIVSRNDAPMYETEIVLGSGSVPRQNSPEAAHLHQFVMHSSLDIVDEIATTSPVPYLKVVNKFYELYVSAYVTAGGARFLMLHDQKNEDGIKSFFQVGWVVRCDAMRCDAMRCDAMLLYFGSRRELIASPMDGCVVVFLLFLDCGCRAFDCSQDVHELYVKALLNPLQQEDGRISSPEFDVRVQNLAKRHL